MTPTVLDSPQQLYPSWLRPPNGPYRASPNPNAGLDTVVVNPGTDQTLTVNGSPMILTTTGGLAPGGPMVPWGQDWVGENNPQGISSALPGGYAAWQAQMEAQAGNAANAYANEVDSSANVVAPAASIDWVSILFWLGIALVGFLILRSLLRGGHR